MLMKHEERDEACFKITITNQWGVTHYDYIFY